MGSNGSTAIAWPEGKRFAFTVFDDPDYQQLQQGQAIYGFLGEMGFRTTKGIWPLASPLGDDKEGATCQSPGMLPWLKELQRSGFELGLHNATSRTSPRERTIAAFDAYADYFGQDPITLSQHVDCQESLYWGPERVSGAHRSLYNVATLGHNRNRFFGSAIGSPYFWGDICSQRVKYVRNFVFREVNTLNRCPVMPYHDPDRKYVKFWYSSSEGCGVERFCDLLCEENQDRLEEEGGACIVYTHFAYRFWTDCNFNPRFKSLMTRLSRKNGWFVPVSTLLDFLLSSSPEHEIPREQRMRMERRWLMEKLRYGTA